MKQLLISFLSLVIVLTTPTFGQVDSVTDQYMGNGNLLVNPGLESGLKSWTNVAGTLSIESSVVIKGKRAGKVVLSSQALNLYQDVTSYQAQLADGVQGLASVRIKTSVSGLRLCPRQAGVINSSLCVSVASSNKWGLYKVPFILGATSNGISINSNGTSVSGTIYFDDAFVGATDLTQNINACNDVSCETEFSASVSSAGVVSNENLDWLTLTSHTLNSGIYTFSINSSVSNTLPMNCVATDAGVNATERIMVIRSVTLDTLVVGVKSATDGTTLVDVPFTLVCQKQGVDFTNAKQLSNGNTYSSTNADTDWASCNFSTLVWQGLGTVTSPDIKCKRRGSDLLMRGRFTTGTVAALEVRIPLPTWNGSALVGAGSGSIPVLSRVGNGIRDRSLIDSAKEFSVLSGAGYSYLNVSAAEYAVALNPFSPGTGTGLFLNTQLVDFSASIPIQGWENSNLIIAELNGLQKCESTLDCTDTFSAKISATGNVSDENVTDFINGNCTMSVGQATCNFGTSIFSVSPNCVVVANGSNVQHDSILWGNATSTQVVIQGVGRGTSTVSSLALPATLVCQKQGADYTGKTAKSVASDQSVATPGITKIKSCYVRYSGSASDVTVCSSTPCVIREDTCGGASVTMPAVGEYILTFSAGKFSPNSYVYCSAQGSRQDTNQNMWYTNFYDSTLQTFKSGADGSFRHNFGFYNGGSYSYNFGNIKCEGKAP